MGKPRDLFKKTGDIKQTFYVKMGTIKDRNSKTLTEAEQIKKRWQKHTEGKYKKSLNDPDNHDVWSLTENQTSLVAQVVSNQPAIWKTWVQFLGWEDPLEEDMAAHSSWRRLLSP